MYELLIANKNYSSWSLRPWVLMRVLDIPFEERLIPLPSDDSGTYRPHSPSGRFPCLVDGETRVWDSLAIVEYLAERHQGVWPEDPVARAFARSASAEMHSGFAVLRNVCPMSCGVRIKLRTKPAALLQDLARIAELWNEGLRRFGGAYLAGDRFTAVDAFFAPVTFRALTYSLDLGGKADAYAERIRALPAMREWYKAAVAEAWREPRHEAEMKEGGEILADYRAC